MKEMHSLGMAALVALVVLAPAAAGQTVQVRVTATNLAPANSIAYAPLRVGFHNGTFDAFNNGQAASAAIISVAEGGSGSDWLPAFSAAEPQATLGSVGGLLLAGQSASAVFEVSPMTNRFFTFASMVVPSNDHFIGNDNPMQYVLFDANGDLRIGSILQRGRDIWDAGSEVTNAANAAFLAGGNNDDRVAENGVVNFNFDQLDAFNGLTTGAGYTFARQFGADDAVYRIDFEIVPAPGAAGLLGLVGLSFIRRRR